MTFSGQVIPLTQVGSGPNYSILGGDISAFAGQNGELRFTAGSGVLDNIQFSPIAIPEPSTVSLVALAGLALLNKSMMTNRRSPLPLTAKRKLGGANGKSKSPSQAAKLPKAYAFS